MKAIFKNWRLIFSICFVISFALGSFSIRPFTKLWLPWMMINQWKKVAFTAADDLQCKNDLKNLGIEYQEVKTPEKDIKSGCIIDTPVVVKGMGVKINNIAFSEQYDYVALSCRFAKKLHGFIGNVVLPEAKKSFKSNVVAFLHKGGYACRGQRQFTVIKSEHAFAQAIDFAGLRFEDGSEILVEKHFHDDSEAGKFLRLIAEKACVEFGTSLGPAFNELHKDHLHWSVGFPEVCIY